MAISFVVSSWIVLGLLLALEAVFIHAEARAFFVFGDSLVDSGNNNYLVTTARADSSLLWSQQIGLSEPPLPSLSPELRGQKLFNGANFASAGVVILNDTGIQFASIIRMFRRFDYFEQYQHRLSALIGAEQTRRPVNQALVLITVGGNDFVNNYYLIPYSARSLQYNLPDYVKFLISEYQKLLAANELSQDIRKNFDLGVGELAIWGTNGGCTAELQRAASLYIPQLDRMVNGLNRKIGRDVFIASNTQQMHSDFVSDPQAYGEQIGLSESPLPYLSPEFNGQKMLVGANFASAGVGILNDTGVQFVNIIRMSGQLEYFQEYKRRLTALVGSRQAHQLVSQALVLITVGGNDFVNNYYLVPYSARSRQYKLPDYVKFLISEYRRLLMVISFNYFL
ncbi:hypothetical protein QQP08_016614 [Theobroma cacao]|nr:hypothetical protein QQP08_016614 [Theobroma cacao]